MESGRTAHVLLVDDEPNLLRVLKRGLEHNGLEVTAVGDPRVAIDTLRQDPDQFDSIVTDFGMPGLNGIEMARLVRSIRADLPILLYSGFLDDKETSDATEAGVTQILNKPIHAAQLAAAIRASHAN